MAGLLLAPRFVERFGGRLSAAIAAAGLRFDYVYLGEGADASLPAEQLEMVEVALFSDDFFPNYPAFFRTARAAPNLRWLHVATAGFDGPLFGQFLERAVRLTTSTGANAVPIAQTTIGGLLALARGFPYWADAQRRREWATLPRERIPPDLDGQVLVVVGLGAIGREVARLGQALGLHVVGVRRSPRTADDPVDELQPPGALMELAPRADWLVLACPLTDETRGLISREVIAALKPTAHVLNVGRGAVVDEEALTEALTAGRLAGAYLDVFVNEPLPAESPLWALPNVIISPHNSSASTGNAGRVAAIFFENLTRYAAGERLRNEV